VPSYTMAQASGAMAEARVAKHVENRRHKQKGDAVQSVAGSVDTVNRKMEAALGAT